MTIPTPHPPASPEMTALVRTLIHEVCAGDYGQFVAEHDLLAAIAQLEADAHALHEIHRVGGRMLRWEPQRYTQAPSGCWLACLAGLTGIPHEELTAFIPPELVADPEHREAYTTMHNRVIKFLAERGWATAYTGKRIPSGYAIGLGKSPRGYDHGVIVLDGKLWWDPHPSRAGITHFVDGFEIVVPLCGILTEADWTAPLDAALRAAERTEGEG